MPSHGAELTENLYGFTRPRDTCLAVHCTWFIVNVMRCEQAMCYSYYTSVIPTTPPNSTKRHSETIDDPISLHCYE